MQMEFKYQSETDRLVLIVKLPIEVGEKIYDAIINSKLDARIMDCEFNKAEELCWFYTRDFSVDLADGETRLRFSQCIKEQDTMDDFDYTRYSVRTAQHDADAAEWMWPNFIAPLRQVLLAAGALHA